MGKLTWKRMRLAGREWARATASAVGKSLAKTLTEAVTNSDTSYKRLHRLPQACGLVDAVLELEKGHRLVFSDVRKSFEGEAPERVIEVHLYTAGGHGKPARTCQVVDHAEGLSYQDIQKALEVLAADKTEVSKGQPGRSLFGRGIGDVLLAHDDGKFWAYKDGLLSSCEVRFDGEEEPNLGFAKPRKPSEEELEYLHLRPDRNGCCVSFRLAEGCRIPGPERIVEILSQFYMLRLINADPNVSVQLYQYRSAKKRLADTLDYEFPIGSVVGRFSAIMSVVLPGEENSPIEIEGMVARADKKRLPGREAGPDGRANGLLIVDNQDAVLDQTFLPDFEGAPYLDNIYGVVKISGIRDLLFRFLELGKGRADSPLTVSRDGFDTKHPFTRELFKALKTKLEPIYRREEERYKEKTGAKVAPEAQRRIDEAIRRLNSYLREMEGEGDEDEPREPDENLTIQFLPPRLRLVAGRERRVRLIVKSAEAKAGGAVVVESHNPSISVDPELQIVDKSRRRKGSLTFPISLNCDSLHEKGTVDALVDTREGETLDAKLEILDVVAETVVQPPEDIEFRPDESRGRPNRVNSLRLFVNTAAIPIGRHVTFTTSKSHGTIGLLHDERITDTLKLKVDAADLLPGGCVARLSVPWRGSGWGQDAKVLASTKLPGGGEVQAQALLLLDQPEDDGAGLIRDIRYGPRSTDECAVLADGVLYINSRHPLNNSVLGKDQDEYAGLVANDFAAQHRLAVLLIEQGVYAAAEMAYSNGRLTLGRVPVTNMRNFIDKHTMNLGQRIVRALTSAAARVAKKR